MFSLVMPTYNRAPILRRSLDHLLDLEGISECEIIVTDDGSSDNTPEVLEEFSRKAHGILRFFRVPNGGPAKARNYALREAKNNCILFVDDDVFPRRDMLRSHGEMLDAGYTGSQGILLWHPEIRITPLIRYIDSRGAQFDFGGVENECNLDFKHIYTGNLAILRDAVLGAGGFDENIGLPFFEDTILAYKVTQNGGRMALNRRAIADHLHDFTEEAFLNRECKVGYSAARLRGQYPEVARKLGWDQKDLFAGSQLQILRLLNASGLFKPLLGYPFSMRLRNREAFYRGLLQFKRETASSR